MLKFLTVFLGVVRCSDSSCSFCSIDLQTNEICSSIKCVKSLNQPPQEVETCLKYLKTQEGDAQPHFDSSHLLREDNCNHTFVSSTTSQWESTIKTTTADLMNLLLFPCIRQGNYYNNLATRVIPCQITMVSKCRGNEI